MCHFLTARLYGGLLVLVMLLLLLGVVVLIRCLGFFLREILVGELHEAVGLDRVDGRHGDVLLVLQLALERACRALLPLLFLQFFHELREWLFLRQGTATSASAGASTPTLALATTLELPGDVIAIDNDSFEFGAGNATHLGILVDDAYELYGIRHKSVLVLQTCRQLLL